MAQQRYAQPDCLRYFLDVLRSPNEERSKDQLVDALIYLGNYSITFANETVDNALRDGLLMACTVSSSPRSSRITVTERVRLPTSNEITQRGTAAHDWYCYECHLPGILEHCSQCWRSFHRLCYRKNAEKPNYSVPSSKTQKNRLPAFSSETDSNSDEEGGTVRSSTVLGYDSDARVSSSVIQIDQSSVGSWTYQQGNSVPDNASNITSNAKNVECAVQTPEHVEGKHLIESDYESKNKVDVVCMGEIRPPQRKRPNTTNISSVSYKSEMAAYEEEANCDLGLCTCCRLLKSANLRNPPNVQADELCYLINFTFQYNREWLVREVDTYMQQDKHVDNAKEKDIVYKCLLYPLEINMDIIADKLDNQEYSLIMEFLVDLLDVQHRIGVFFGAVSTEMESTKWLLRDITHDLSEIRRCPDCFRYSHEKQSTIWFAKPCVQRHELVYAKHSSFPYWPAKVIRVLANNKHDVRFFGGNHSRALIDPRYIKSIDTDVKSLKLGNSPAMKKALEELRCHQMLSTYPPSSFSFHANSLETEEIIRNVLASSISGGGSSSKTSQKVAASSSNSSGNTRKGNRKRKLNGLSAIGSDSNEIESLEATSQSSNQSKNQMVAFPKLSVSLRRLRAEQIGNIFPSEESNKNRKTPKRTTRNAKNNPVDDNAETLAIMLKELDETRKTLNEYKQKYEKAEAQKQKFKEAIKKKELELKIIKRKPWCYWCLEEAIYLCCFRAAYCSETCQKRHWKDGHNLVCKNQSNNNKS